jgi:hypothetical protein
MKQPIDLSNIFFDPYKLFKIQSFWSDDNTFPDALDTGETVECETIDDAIKEAMKNVKPQVKRFIDPCIYDDHHATLSYYPTPSKNKTGYTETIEICRVFNTNLY